VDSANYQTPYGIVNYVHLNIICIMCYQLLCGVDCKSRPNYIDIALTTAHDIFGFSASGSNETNPSLRQPGYFRRNIAEKRSFVTNLLMKWANRIEAIDTHFRILCSVNQPQDHAITVG